MIQDIGNHRVETVFIKEEKLGKEDYVIGFEGEYVYLKKEDGNLSFLTCEELLPICYEKEAFDRYQKDSLFLMKVDGISLFLLPVRDIKENPKGVKESIFAFRKKGPKHIAYAMISAYHLYRWYETTKFCGACGVRLRHSTEERAMECPICKNIIYPKISPAIIAGVVHEDKILLTKYAQRGRNYHYALVAGFCEVGETIEETVHREVLEETGVRVKDLKYYKSQPWASSQSLLSGFFAKLDGDEHIHIDEHELSMAKWVKREDLKELNPEKDISLTAEMIEYFRIHPEAFELSEK